MSRLFDAANRLWFEEGRTTKALAAYEAAFRETPDDPVVAFQLADVLSSFDRFAEAQAMLDRAQANRDKLSASAQVLLEVRRAGMRSQPQERPFAEIPPAKLDRDYFEANPLPPGGWETVASAAAARGMYGLAAYALDQWKGVPVDTDEAKEFDRIQSRRDTQEAALDQMYAAPGRSEPSPRAATPARSRTSPTEAPAPRESSPKPPAEAAAVPPQTPVEGPALPPLPLELTVRVDPADAPVGAPTTLLATLRNPTPTPQLVNRRMLLNHRGAPGEVRIDVQGPPGYRNNRGYQVRAGQPAPEFFVSLAPSAALEKSWALHDYQSLHVPGEYRVTVTYHNEATRAPDGRPMSVGGVSGTASFRRHA